MGLYTGSVPTRSALVVVCTPAVFVLCRRSLWSVHRPCSYSLGARCGPHTTPAVFVKSYSLGARCGPHTTPAVFVLSRRSLWSVHHTGRVRTLSALLVVRTPRRPCSYSLGARCGPYATLAVFVLSRRSFGAGQGVGLGNVWLPPCGGVETGGVQSNAVHDYTSLFLGLSTCLSVHLFLQQTAGHGVLLFCTEYLRTSLLPSFQLPFCWSTCSCS